jgi:hypothetical protein
MLAMLSQTEISAIAVEVARLLAPLLGGKLADDPTSRKEAFTEKHGDPSSFAARRQACLDIAAKKGVLKRTIGGAV